LKEKNKFFYSSTIKLPPAIGDWTEIKSFNSQNDFFEITDVNYSNFDSISKDDLKFVQKIHHRIASQMIDHLSYNLNAKVELHTISATQLLYSDFIESISDNVFQSTINLPEKSSINILFGSNLASMVIDRLVGGKGIEDVKQEFNPLEMDLLSEQIQNFIPFFQSAWEDVLDFSDVNVSLSSGKYVKDHQISLRGTMVVFTIYLFFGDGELLRLIVAYPSKLISRLLNLYRSKKRHIKSSVKLDKNTIKDINYKVVAELGTIKLTMDAIQKLDVGDIISLDKPIHSYIKLKIGDHVTLTGQPCVYKKRLGCQIVVASQIKSAIKLVHDSYQNDVHNHSPRVTFSLDSLVEDRSIDSISNMDHGINSPVVSSQELAQFIPADLLSKNVDEGEEETAVYETSDSDLEINDVFEAKTEANQVESSEGQTEETVSEFMPEEEIAIYETSDSDLEINDVFEAKTEANQVETSEEQTEETVSEFMPEEETAFFETGNDDLEINDVFEAKTEANQVETSEGQTEETVSEFMPEEETAFFETGNDDLEINDVFEAKTEANQVETSEEQTEETVSEFMPEEEIAIYETSDSDLEINDVFEAETEANQVETSEGQTEETVSEFMPEEEIAIYETGDSDLEINDVFEVETEANQLETSEGQTEETVSEFMPEEEIAIYETSDSDLEINDVFEVEIDANQVETSEEQTEETVSEFMPEEETAIYETSDSDLEINDVFEVEIDANQVETSEEQTEETVSEFMPEEETAIYETSDSDLEINDVFEVEIDANQVESREENTEEKIEIETVVNLSDIETDALEFQTLDVTEDEENISDDVSDTSELNREQFSSELEELMLEDIPDTTPVGKIVLDTESSDADLTPTSDTNDDGSSLENNNESDSESFSYLNDIQFFDGETLESNDKDTL
jgi:flagellar motor switch protein FliM